VPARPGRSTLGRPDTGAGALVDASRNAQFLVVGHRGLGGFAELPVGSVGVRVTTHARDRMEAPVREFTQTLSRDLAAEPP
jgi:hypothetical protein